MSEHVWTATKPCDEWSGTRLPKPFDYGYRMEHGKRIYVHREAWEKVNGPIPNGLLVCHHCDNPPCREPEHLFLGTKRDNAIDMRNKGRGNWQTKPETVNRGENHGRAKLTEKDVRQIRGEPMYRGLLTDLARKHGVTKALICSIRARRIWRHIPSEA